jgi:hypothetical protein
MVLPERRNAMLQSRGAFASYVDHTTALNVTSTPLPAEGHAHSEMADDKGLADTALAVHH